MMARDVDFRRGPQVTRDPEVLKVQIAITKSHDGRAMVLDVMAARPG